MPATLSGATACSTKPAARTKVVEAPKYFPSLRFLDRNYGWPPSWFPGYHLDMQTHPGYCSNKSSLYLQLVYAVGAEKGAPP